MSTDVMSFLTYLDYTGVFVFAISGILAAREKGLDWFGGLAVAFFTALGGGTIRDLLLDADIAWMANEVYVYLVFVGAITAIIFKQKALKLRKTIFLFDTIGLGVFTLIGVKKAMVFEMSPIIVVMLGMVTATFGGVIRDVICNEIPLLFRKELYAVVSLIGSLVYLLMLKLGIQDWIAISTSVLVIILVRLLTVIKKWNFPLLNKENS